MSAGQRIIAVLVIVLTFCGVSRGAAAPATGSATPVAVVRLDGKVDDYNRDGFFKRFNQAKASGAKVIIIDLDTYGGLVTSGLDISRFIKGQSDVHTIA